MTARRERGASLPHWPQRVLPRTELSGSGYTDAMDRIVGMREARTQLSSLVTAALAGDDVVLSRSGAPVARIVPLESPQNQSIFGIAAGKIPEMSDAQWEESDRALTAQFGR